MAGKYDDIIYLSRPVSQRHARMTIQDRAAQFAPFAALTGHYDALKEEAGRSARYYSDKDSIFVSEEELFALDDDIVEG